MDPLADYLLGVICDIQEMQEVGVSAQLAHDLHHTDALPQAAGRCCACRHQRQVQLGALTRIPNAVHQKANYRKGQATQKLEKSLAWQAIWLV